MSHPVTCIGWNGATQFGLEYPQEDDVPHVVPLSPLSTPLALVPRTDLRRMPVLPDVDQRISRSASSIIAAKERSMKEALETNWHGLEYKKRNPVFWGGDLLSFGYLGLEGAQTASSYLQSLSGLTIVGSAFGILGGLINIGVGLFSIPEALEASRKDDFLNKTRLWLDAICMIGIGIVMLLASIAKLALEVGALGAVGLFFATHPWILPLLLLIVTIPTLWEVGNRVIEIASKKDWGNKLRLDLLQKSLHPEGATAIRWEPLRAFLCEKLGVLPAYECEDLSAALCNQMNEIEQNIGVEATLPLFRLLKAIGDKNKEEARTEFLNLEREIKAWRRAQTVRLVQQILYVLAFILSMLLLIPGLSFAGSRTITWIQTAGLVGANGIPLYMDLYWPFKRNTPIILPKVEERETVPLNPIEESITNMKRLIDFYHQLPDPPLEVETELQYELP
jgi:hypothetical protein